MFKNLSTAALGTTGTQNETIELALSYGFRGIDLDIVEFSRQVESRGLEQSRRLLKSSRLAVGNFELPLSLEADDDDYRTQLAGLSKMASLAADLGCTRAVTVIAPASDERPYHQNFEFHRRRLGEIADALLPHQVQLAVGFEAAAVLRQDRHFEFMHQFDALNMLLALVGRPNAGLLVDLWNMYLSGAGAAAIQGLRPQQVVSVRVADIPAEVDAANATPEARLLPGETGTIDCAAALMALRDIGYDGPVTPYPHLSQFQGVRRDEVVKRAGNSLDALWQAAGLDGRRRAAVTAHSS
jgi:sugar phosphate isomerase/epimerase